MKIPYFLKLILGLLFIGFIIFLGYKLPKKETKKIETVTQEKTEIPYFDENAKVMYFYSDYCYSCQEQKKVLEKLGEQGYKVKPIDLEKDRTLGIKYQIEGTPTFLGPDGKKLVGYQKEDVLKNWLNQYQK